MSDPTGSPGVADALAAALRSEHAAVHGYGLVGSRLRPPVRDAATAAWNAHRAARDDLADRLNGLGSRVPAAEPVYRMPVAVTSARTAAQLAAALEDDVVAAYAGLAGCPDAASRARAATVMREAAVRAVRWRRQAGVDRIGPAEAFPGLPDTALGPRPQPGGEPSG